MIFSDYFEKNNFLGSSEAKYEIFEISHNDTTKDNFS